jgi:uncharacterized protein (UPF0248 family)
MAFQTLNRLKWKGGLKGCSVTVLHRGAPKDRKTIGGNEIACIKKSYFIHERNGRETTIPLHRIIEITVGGKTVWKRKIKKG